MFKVRKLKKDIWNNSSEVKEQELCGEQVQLRGARKINKGRSERTSANTVSSLLLLLLPSSCSLLS